MLAAVQAGSRVPSRPRERFLHVALAVIMASLAGAFTAAPALAAPQIFTYFCYPTASCSTRPGVDVSFSADRSLHNTGQITVTDPASNRGSRNWVITEVDGRARRALSAFSAEGPPTAADGTSQPTGPNGWCDIGWVADSPAYPQYFTCQLADPEGTTSDGAIRVGQSQTFAYSSRSGISNELNSGDVFTSISIVFNYANLPPGCRPALNNAMTWAAVFATRAGDCTTPSRTRITRSQIDQRRHRAAFRFKASRATRYLCELDRNGRRLYRDRCSSPKVYAGRLERGTYLFTVWGVDHAGSDPRPGEKLFRIR